MNNMYRKVITIVFIIMVGSYLSGCTENIADNEHFIGSWDGRYEAPEDLAGQLETEAIFYDNGTLKTIYYQISGDQKNKSNIDLVKYEIHNGELYLRDIGTNEILSRVNYTFSDNYSILTFTSGSDPDFIYILTKSSD